MRFVRTAATIPQLPADLRLACLSPSLLRHRGSDLERLYARLEDEYELKERANALQHKLQVIEGTSRALIDIIDTERSSRLEATIVLLIVVEVLIAFYDLFFRLAK